MFNFFTSQFGVSLVLIVVLIGGIMTAVAYCIYFERKISAWIQDRKGPNRAGPWGLLQPLADGVKFFFKEDIIPGHVDKPLFVLAPGVIFFVAMVGFAVIPWGGRLDLGTGTLLNVQVANPDIGLLYILGVAAMGVYGVVLGAWASNNKFSLYGGIRAAAQMLSYEIPMGLGILTIVLISGQLRLEELTLAQMGTVFDNRGNDVRQVWNVLLHPLAFLIVFITALAEANRAPFDLAEAEQELVGGYHTEYSALKFGLFFLAEYAHMITSSAFLCVLFFGGWHLPWVPALQPEATTLASAVLKMLCLGAKISFFIGLVMVIRWTLPRFRFDQLMRLAWKAMVPAGMGLVLLATVLVYTGQQRSVFWSLAGNMVILVISLAVAANTSTPVTGRQANLPTLPTRPAVSM